MEMTDLPTRRSFAHAIEIEMDKFEQIEHPPRDYDILEWWKNHAPQFPMLSEFARKILCIPAASTSSERVFSQTGNIVSFKRTKLQPSHVEQLIFVKKNFEKVNVENCSLSNNELD
jgi:hypothetical protein